MTAAAVSAVSRAACSRSSSTRIPTAPVHSSAARAVSTGQPRASSNASSRGASPAPFAFPRYLRQWFDLSPAQVAVYKALRKIRFGETRSYEDVARATGLHPRQIGWLIAANHLALLIPCHRVVGKDGSLVGYSGGLEAKRWLLGHELRKAGVVLR